MLKRLNSPRSIPERSKALIAEAFGEAAPQYEEHAVIQRQVAAMLARRLPRLERGRILEIGCGTGLLSRHLIARYPGCELLLTDISEDMIAEARQRLSFGRNVQFEVQDGEWLQLEGEFDLIVSSMAVQWFEEPSQGLLRLSSSLAEGGRLLYTTTGPNNFREWSRVLETRGIRQAKRAPRILPGIIESHYISHSYPSGFAFLQELKGIGAHMAEEGYRPVSPGTLRRLLRDWERESGRQMTWEIVIGELGP